MEKNVNFKLENACLVGSNYSFVVNTDNKTIPQHETGKLTNREFFRRSQFADNLPVKYNWLKNEIRSNSSYDFSLYFVVNADCTAIWHESGNTSDERGEFTQPTENSGYYYYVDKLELIDVPNFETGESGLMELYKELKKRVNEKNKVKLQIQLGLLDTL